MILARCRRTSCSLNEDEINKERKKKKQWITRNLPTQQHRIHHSLQQRLFRASKKRLGELIMFVGCVARRRISREKVIFHDELFWKHNFLLYQSSTFFGYLTHFFFSLFFEEIVVLHSSTNALVSGLPSPSSLNPLPPPSPLPPPPFDLPTGKQTHKHP